LAATLCSEVRSESRRLLSRSRFSAAAAKWSSVRRIWPSRSLVSSRAVFEVAAKFWSVACSWARFSSTASRSS